MTEEVIIDEEENDLVKIILAFTQHIEGQRGIKTGIKKVCPACKCSFNPLESASRDEFLATIILSLVADPNHHVGKTVGRQLFKTWIDRGGRVPKHGALSREMREKAQFEFAVQYLYDYGMPVKEIANALSCSELTVRNHIKYQRRKLPLVVDDTTKE